MILQFGYFGLMVMINLILAYFGFTAIDRSFAPEKSKKKKFILILGLIIWQVYIYTITTSGFIQTFEFPPRFALTMIFPAFIFTGVFVYRNRNNDWTTHIPSSWLFFFQSFRILVEVLFVMSVTEGILHKEASIEGYNFDMAYAFTVPIVGYIVFFRKKLSMKVIRIWNYLGLLVLATVIFVFMTTIYLPEIYGATQTLMPIEGLTYPYVLVAGFLMPCAVFVHVLSIAQLNRILKS
ncbi:hypothetical protein [Ekhidna sp.]